MSLSCCTPQASIVPLSYLTLVIMLESVYVGINWSRFGPFRTLSLRFVIASYRKGQKKNQRNCELRRHWALDRGICDRPQLPMGPWMRLDAREGASHNTKSAQNPNQLSKVHSLFCFSRLFLVFVFFCCFFFSYHFVADILPILNKFFV